MGLVCRGLGDRAAVLCDDRNIVRRGPDGFSLFGTWSHGDVTDVSAKSGQLRAVPFPSRAPATSCCRAPTISRMRRLLATLIKPMVTADWWESEIDVLEGIVNEVPCYRMLFDKSGGIVAELERLLT